MSLCFGRRIVVVFRRLGLLSAALACFCIAGGQWTVLQGVAWARMVADYSQASGSLVTGIAQTFDGQHACNLCLAIQAAKSKAHQEKAASFGAKEDAKVKALPVEVVALVQRTSAEIVFARFNAPNMAARVEPPPTPPPRRIVLAA